MTTVGEAFRILRRNRGMISYFITRLFRDLFPCGLASFFCIYLH